MHLYVASIVAKILLTKAIRAIAKVLAKILLIRAIRD
jgi:hypothetical protein